MTSVLFVCLGNICRSPMAEGIFRSLVKARNLEGSFRIDSAGTGGWHAGEAPDPRAQSCVRGHGVDIAELVARQFRAEDFEEFDHILVMDERNFSDVMDQLYDPSHTTKVKKFLDFHPDPKLQNVPDPYHGGADGFEHVFDMLTIACENFLSTLEKNK